jgi:hypothetical protein
MTRGRRTSRSPRYRWSSATGAPGTRKRPLGSSSIDPEGRLLIGFVAGKRDASLSEDLIEFTKRRLRAPTELLVATDAENSCESFFPSVCVEPYRPARHGRTGCFPKVRPRVNTSLGDLQLIMRRERVGESWRSSPGRRTALGGWWRCSWRSWAMKSPTCRPSSATTLPPGE